MRSWLRILVLAVVVAAAVGIGVWYHWQQQQNRLPTGFATGNGRLEAQEIDIATKYPGRVAVVLADEGDSVEAGAILARMDTKSLEAALAVAEARERQARESARQAVAELADARSRVVYAEAELDRALVLLQKGYVSTQRVDQRRTEQETAAAVRAAAEAHLADMGEAAAAAAAEVRRLKVEIDEAVLTAPVGGRVLYRLAEPGEVLAAGGKVLTIVDLADVYMTLFLPAVDAGRVPVGAEARILLDAFADRPLAARVSFVAAAAQFTPKEVETADERQKLVFRVKAQLMEGDPALLKPGMPGVAYIRYDRSVAWPAWLE